MTATSQKVKFARVDFTFRLQWMDGWMMVAAQATGNRPPPCRCSDHIQFSLRSVLHLLLLLSRPTDRNVDQRKHANKMSSVALDHPFPMAWITLFVLRPQTVLVAMELTGQSMMFDRFNCMLGLYVGGTGLCGQFVLV